MIILLVICLVVFAFKMLGLAAKLTWGITKSIFSIVLLPALVIGMLIAGILKIAIPIALVGIILVVLFSKAKK